MSYNSKLIQARPNTNVAFFHPSDAVVAKLEELKTQGKIISFKLNELSEDGLTKTMTVVYNTSADFISCIDDLTLAESATARAAHCATNNISFSVETD